MLSVVLLNAVMLCFVAPVANTLAYYDTATITTIKNVKCRLQVQCLIAYSALRHKRFYFDLIFVVRNCIIYSDMF
jgi:hypothetical protein